MRNFRDETFETRGGDGERGIQDESARQLAGTAAVIGTNGPGGPEKQTEYRRKHRMNSINLAITRVVLSVSSFAARLRDEERGQDLLEYALLGGLIAAALVAIFAIFGTALVDMGTNIAKCIDFDSVATTCAP